jgi:hypothetical protein
MESGKQEKRKEAATGGIELPSFWGRQESQTPRRNGLAKVSILFLLSYFPD